MTKEETGKITDGIDIEEIELTPEDYFQAPNEREFRRPEHRLDGYARDRITLSIQPTTVTEIRKFVMMGTSYGNASGLIDLFINIGIVMFSKDIEVHQDRMVEIAYSFYKAFDRHDPTLDIMADNLVEVAEYIRNMRKIENRILEIEKLQQRATDDYDEMKRIASYADQDRRKKKESIGKGVKYVERKKVKLRTLDDLLRVDDDE